MKRYDFGLESAGFDRWFVDIKADKYGEWVRAEDAICLEDHIKEAMKLMRDNGSDETEYVIYSVLAAALNHVDSDVE